MRQVTEWKFDTLSELTKFKVRFYDIQEDFFPNQTLGTEYVPLLNDVPAHYLATLKDRPKMRKFEDEQVDGFENRIGAHDTVSFMKQTESNQSPDTMSYIQRLKTVKDLKKTK
mgnify:CR=1 FL=1